MKTILVTPRSFGKGDRTPLDLLEQAGYRVVCNPCGQILTKEQMCQHVAQADGIILGVDPLDREVLDAAPKLRAIAKYGVGTDNIDLEYAKSRGIAVSVTSGANADAVADYAFAMLLAAARGLAQSDAQCRAGRWDRMPGVDLYGKTLGILGMGAIGRGVARRAQGFNMQVLGYDVCWDADFARACPVERTTLPELLARADFLTLHLPLLPQTRHIIDAAALASMKSHAVLVNTARGGLIDEAALVAALRGGIIRAAAIDVFEQEPPTDPRLYELNNLLMSAHSAAATDGAAAQMGQMAAQNLLRDLEGGGGGC